ncbi:MAG: hypothetical protein WCR52_21855 [Bacteroidota bacterium]|uniref:hypothetical protein n=1 Tax=Runella sp. TaxID=1960881 RepID=UPI00301AD8B4
MQELIELVRLINATKLKSTGLWSIILEPGSKMEQLFEAIQQGQVSTDEEASALLYDGQKSGSKFINLKERLKDRLLSVIFLLDFQQTTQSDRQKAHFECNKKWATASILMTKNAKKNGIGQMEEMLQQSVHFEFTELTLNALSALRLHYGTIYGDTNRYNMYREMYRNYQQVLLMENEAEDAYTHLISHYVNSKSTKLEIAKEAERQFKQIKPYMDKCNSFRLHLCGRLIEVTIHSSRNDYASTAQVCEDAVAFFRSKDFESSLPLQAFYYQLIVCYIQLREFDKGRAIMEQYQSLFEEGSFNWFKLQELFFLLATYTKHYEEAWEVCERTLAKLKSSNLPPAIQEMWKIYEAYVYYLVLVGKIKHESAQAAAAKFRVGKFLNDTPTYSKDKRGMNIPILIIQILYSLLDRNYHQTIDRIDAIDKYVGRYLKQDDTFRSNCLIKLLMQIPAASFHREGVIRRSEKYIAQLNSKPVEVAYQSHEVEIIPYEDLWEMTIDSLQNQLHQLGKKGRNK